VRTTVDGSWLERFRSRGLPGRAPALLAVAGLVASCAGAGPHTLSWPADRTIAVAHGDRIRNWPQAISSVVEVLQGPLGLPPVEFSVSFYPSRGAFERGLIDSGYPPEIARRTAATLDGVGMPRRVLLYEGAVARTTWTARVAMLAHEIVHVLQYDLAAGRQGTSEQWIREGYAEWVSMRALEILHMTGAAGRRNRARRAVALAGSSRLPSLSELATWEQWADLRTERPGLPAYPYAFVATEFLVDRHGVDAVLDYFRRFAVSDDAEGNFAAAFDESRAELEAAFRGHLAGR
jgi:hypothetical protein